MRCLKVLLSLIFIMSVLSLYNKIAPIAIVASLHVRDCVLKRFGEKSADSGAF